MLNIGIVGSGFASILHLESYHNISLEGVCLYAICSKDDKLQEVADRFGIPHVYHDYQDMLNDPQINMVDIITPPALHADMIVEAMNHGKDVICEKPLTGFFEDAIQDGQPVPVARMREAAEANLQRIGDAMKATGKQLFYAENYVYAPSVQKCAEFLRHKKSKVMLVKGEESHSGSHAAHAPYFRLNGGGALIRQGVHPLSAALYLKQVEAKARGEEIRPVSVTAVSAQLSKMLKGDEHRYIHANPYDTEDFASVLITFSDGSVAQILASDNTLGGTRNNMEVYTHEGVYQCNIAPSNGMMVYHENDENLHDIYFTEKLGQYAGWQPIFLEENLMRGYQSELRNFLYCAQNNVEPEAGYPLALDTIRLVYAAYQSAQEGRAIAL